MTKPHLQESRYDFRQGRNSAVSPDLLNESELVDATNVRIDTSYGGFTKRTGTRRLHTTALASGIVYNVIQWDSPGGKELVAIDDTLWHKTSALGDFTQVVPATHFISAQPMMTPFRSISSGAALVLYIASGRLYSWDGTTVTVLAPAGLPTDIDKIAAHATRMFARSTSFPKSLYWSKVGDATSYLASGLSTDGGSAPVNVLNGEAINALEAIGGSLLIGAEDSVSRFTGTSSDNIQLATDLMGISTEIGPTGTFALKRFETAAALLNERGPHVVTEAGIVPIGIKVEPDFLNVTAANISKAAIGYHRGRKEIWFAIPTVGNGENRTVYVYSTRLQAWMGPWTYPFGINTFARYEDANGAENLIAGCNDGFVRLMDDVGNYLDDRHADGTGGTSVTMTAEVAPHFFNQASGFGKGDMAGPGVVKSLDMMTLDAALGAGSSLVIKHSMDTDPFVTETAIVPATTAAYPYRVDLDNQGKRLRLQFTDASTDAPIIYGYTIYAWNMNRK